MGWPIPMLAADMGSSTTAVTHWRKAPLVIARTAVTVRGAYNRHAMRQGPSEIASARAAAHGWVGPLAWDDATIDDPNATPDPGTPSRSLFLIEDAEMLARLDYTPAQAAARLGVDRDSMRRRLERQGRTDILDRFALTARTT